MAKVIVTKSKIDDLATSISTKSGVATPMTLDAMKTAVDSISGGGGITPSGTISITENGTHDVTNYASANVAVPIGITPTGTKQVSITQNGTTTEDVTSYANVQIDVDVAPTLVSYVIRPDAELIQTYTYDKYAVEDEGWTIPSYTTTAQILKAAASLSPTVSVDLNNYRYIVSERFLSIPEYSVETKAKGRAEYTFCNYFYEIARVEANEIATLIDPTKKITSVQNLVATNSLFRMLYWTSSSAIALYSSNGYGVYQTPSAPSVSGSTLTVKAPAYALRGSTTYFTSTYMNALTDIRYQYVIDVYRAPLDNLNVDGWEQDQMLQHIIDCVNSDGHKLT